jgi:hypothetical protein
MIPEESEESMIIKYNDKDYTIPTPFDKCFFGAEPTRELTIHNRFSDETFQQSCKLPSFAVAIYDTIIGAEANEDYNLIRLTHNIHTESLCDSVQAASSLVLIYYINRGTRTNPKKVN